MAKTAAENEDDRIPVIDLFAGPGGLGEGFASHSDKFRIVLSVEKDKWAHQTLELRAFYRQFPRGKVPKTYFEHVAIANSRDRLADRDQLFESHPEEAAAARFEACLAELGTEEGEAEVRQRLQKVQSEGADLSHAILIGGPPCQAYSVVGRSRRAKDAADGTYDETEDPRHQLYRWYLRILEEFRPAAFVMENVRGILSSRYGGEPIFPKIVGDLEYGRQPEGCVGTAEENSEKLYELFPLYPKELVGRSRTKNPPAQGQDSSVPFPRTAAGKDFVVFAEQHGVPQKRTRVFIVGIRGDRLPHAPPRLKPEPIISVRQMLHDLPPLRSGLSKTPDNASAWTKTVKEAADVLLQTPLLDQTCKEEFQAVKKRIRSRKRGAESIQIPPPKDPEKPWQRRMPLDAKEWTESPKLKCVLNHETRGHIPGDLMRYLFAAAWGAVNGSSPTLKDYPEDILPEHKNVQAAKNSKTLATAKFADRFRVQVADLPSTTITSHIGKDGHYYIHYDPRQCRSLTVREAARLQTFPDDYLFCGPRTEQYKQVGNAVPPYLAQKIAKALHDSLTKPATRATR